MAKRVVYNTPITIPEKTENAIDIRMMVIKPSSITVNYRTGNRDSVTKEFTVFDSGRNNITKAQLLAIGVDLDDILDKICNKIADIKDGTVVID